MNPQYRILSLLRDEGPLSRAELGDVLELPRPRVVAELDRLVAAGLVREAGPAASPRRAPLDAGRAEPRHAVRRRRPRAPPRSTSRSPTAGWSRSAAYSEPADIRTGPKAILHRVNEILAKFKAEGAYERLPRHRHRRARAGELPRRRAGVAADHAGLGPLPGPRAARPRARLPGRGRQRREHHDHRRAVRRRRPLGRQPAVRQDRHRHRLRHLPQWRGLPRHRRLRRRHRAHPGRQPRAGLLVRQRRLPGGALRRRGAGPRRAGRGPVGRLAGARRAADRQRRRHREGRRRRRRRGRRHLHPAHPRGRPAGRQRAGRPGQLHQPVDDRDRRRAGRARAHPAGRDPQRGLPAVAAAGDRQPAGRPVRAGSARRRCRRGRAGQRDRIWTTPHETAEDEARRCCA